MLKSHRDVPLVKPLKCIPDFNSHSVLVTDAQDSLWDSQSNES